MQRAGLALHCCTLKSKSQLLDRHVKIEKNNLCFVVMMKEYT